MNETTKPAQIGQSDFKSTDSLLTLYSTAISQINSHIVSIWSRFNYLVAINTGLFAIYFLARREVNTDDHLPIMLLWVSLLGIYLSVWTFITMRGAWRWHRHWVNGIKKIEGQFPEGNEWAKIYNSDDKARNGGTFSILNDELEPGLFFGRMQPIIAGFIVAWSAILLMTVWQFLAQAASDIPAA